MAATFGHCGNCDERLAARGGLPPRFCPRCGYRVPAGPSFSPAGARRDFGTTAQGVSTPAIVSFVLGLIGLPMTCMPFGLAAILVGIYARGHIEQSRGRLRGDGLAIAGITLGVISSGLWLTICAAAL